MISHFLASPAAPSPTVARGALYAGSIDAQMHAFDAAGSIHCAGTPTVCTPLWSDQRGAAVTSSPALAGGSLYVGADGGLAVYGIPG